MGIMPRPMRLTRIDVDQHLWPEPFLAALEDRTERPFLRDGVLVLEGEPAARFEPGPHDPDRRPAELCADGIDRALVALSSPLGIEALPRAEAQPLLAAWHDGVFALGEPFGVWGAVALDGASARDVEARGVEAVLPLLHAPSGAAPGWISSGRPRAAPHGTASRPGRGRVSTRCASCSPPWPAGRRSTWSASPAAAAPRARRSTRSRSTTRRPTGRGRSRPSAPSSASISSSTGPTSPSSAHRPSTGSAPPAITRSARRTPHGC